MEAYFSSYSGSPGKGIGVLIVITTVEESRA